MHRLRRRSALTVSFHRDRFFWNTSLQTAIVASFIGGFGPAQSLLQKNQGTSLTIAGLHGTAMGIGSILAGVLNARLAHKYGREQASWIGILIFMVGASSLVIFTPVYATITSVLVASAGVAITINNMVTTISHRYDSQAAKIAIAQANAISAVGSILGTAIVSLIAIYFAGGSQWKFGILFSFPFIVLLYLYNRNIHDVHIADTEGRQRGKLSRQYWWAWGALIASIGVEFCTSFWAAALIKDRTGASAAIGTACVVAVTTGMTIGRWYGGLILKRFSIDQQLLILYATYLIGFAIFWLSHSLVLSIVALFIVGAGISIQFPLTALRLIILSGGRPDLAQGVASNGGGLAIALGPFLLAALADQIGISQAYLMVPVLVVVAAIIVKLVPTPEVRS